MLIIEDGVKLSFDEYFDKLFDPDKFNWEDSWRLARRCSEYFDTWFYPDKFKWKYSDYLEKYCPDKKHIWGQYVTEDLA